MGSEGSRSHRDNFFKMSKPQGEQTLAAERPSSIPHKPPYQARQWIMRRYAKVWLVPPSKANVSPEWNRHRSAKLISMSNRATMDNRRFGTRMDFAASQRNTRRNNRLGQPAREKEYQA